MKRKNTISKQYSNFLTDKDLIREILNISDKEFYISDAERFKKHVYYRITHSKSVYVIVLNINNLFIERIIQLGDKEKLSETPQPTPPENNNNNNNNNSSSEEVDANIKKEMLILFINYINEKGVEPKEYKASTNTKTEKGKAKNDTKVSKDNEGNQSIIDKIREDFYKEKENLKKLFEHKIS